MRDEIVPGVWEMDDFAIESLLTVHSRSTNSNCQGANLLSQRLFFVSGPDFWRAIRQNPALWDAAWEG